MNRKRKENESQTEYRENLKTEQSVLRVKLSGHFTPKPKKQKVKK